MSVNKLSYIITLSGSELAVLHSLTVNLEPLNL